MTLGSILQILLFILIGWTLVSFFLIRQWFDARARLKVVRETTRDETVRAIKANYEKCNKLLYIGIGIAVVFILLPFWNMIITVLCPTPA